MAESVCRKCGKPIEKVNGKWLHKSAGRSAAEDLYQSEHHANPGKRQ